MLRQAYRLLSILTDLLARKRGFGALPKSRRGKPLGEARALPRPRKNGGRGTLATSAIKSTYTLNAGSIRALEALDRLQSSVRERGVDLPGWEQEVIAERLKAGEHAPPKAQ